MAMAQLSDTYPLLRDQNFAIAYDVIQEIEAEAASSLAHCSDMTHAQYLSAYKKIADLCGRFRRAVTCRSDDTTLPPRGPRPGAYGAEYRDIGGTHDDDDDADENMGQFDNKELVQQYYGSGQHDVAGPSQLSGSFGPDCYDTFLECFPLEHRHEFVNGKELRPYDNRIDVWPKCNHNKLCVVQVYDGFQDGGRWFFRCPIGEAYFDEQNCRYARWVDPRNFYHTDEYINYLKCKINNLRRKVDCLNSQLKEATPYPYTVSLIEDPLCLDVWCKCPYHMKKN
ncbi:hypothetical protein HU200_029285 [Digitaria exilis]|uniref:GRF-type domain-containing protein n=1 Tax=Digitaria exilis TaxID=1010633 RepID=A0A835EPE1_9POAL|nr:hypothetical protein HU200_029285 [Digitaria exilis]